MMVKKVSLQDLDTTYCCVSEASSGSSWVKALPESREWFKNNLGIHVEGYHLLDGTKAVGLIYYATSENAMIPYEIEPKVACIYCTEILKGYAGKRFGKMMFDYAKNDLKRQKYKGMAVVASDFKEWMHYELFLKHGFKTIKENPPFKVMYYPLTQETVTVKPLNLNYTPSRDNVEITLFNNFFCPVGAYMYHLIKTVAKGFGDKVKITEIEATLEAVRKYGTVEPLINGKIKFFGPTSEDQVRKAIQEEIGHFKNQAT